ALIPIGFNPEPDVIYQWSPATDVIDPSSSSTSIVTNNQTVNTITTTYTLTASNATGCVTTDQVEITVDPVPVVNFASPGAQCFENNLFQYNAGGNLIPGASYTWSFGPGATPNESSDQVPGPVTYASPGTY